MIQHHNKMQCARKKCSKGELLQQGTRCVLEKAVRVPGQVRLEKRLQEDHNKHQHVKKL